jgi:hypothetical protein
MIAVGIFFVALFAILGLVSNSLRSARIIQQTKNVDAGMAAAQLAYQLTHTNQVSEGLQTVDLGEAYADYDCTADLYQISTNGLCQVDILVRRRASGQAGESKMSILLFLPNLQQGGPGAGFRR